MLRRSLGRRLGVAASLALASCSTSPTEPGAILFLEGRLSVGESDAHVAVLERSGITTIGIDDLRKLLWDVTLGGTESEPSIVLGVGLVRSGECEVTGQLLVHEGETYLWALAQGEHCFVLSDSGVIPPDGLLAYVVRLELPG